MGTKQKVAIGVAVAALAGISAFLFLSRPLSAPTEMAGGVVDTGDLNNTPQTGQGEKIFSAATGTNATFEIDETLNGQPKHVVGTTNNVLGQVTFNAVDPSLSKVGIFKINARTLKTDNDRRDNTVGRLILKSAEDAHEYIIFEPSAVQDMKKIGDELTFKVPGKLTVAGVTKDVTFEGKANVEGNTMNATATATVKYQDFGMEIPKLKFLAWVDDKVKLSINFVGQAL